ncbi:MAG: hypothetical protein ACF8QF_03910 [Phycisphaerales bacterium]
MVTRHAVVHELKAVGVAMLFFGSWIGALLLVKHLVLAEYEVRFYGYSAALVGALVLSKVVLVLERVPLGGWVHARSAWVGVVARTVLYTAGVILVMGIEHGVRGRAEHGGFIPAVEAALTSTRESHLWANAVGIGGALLAWNVLVVVRAHLGEWALLRMLLAPLPRTGARHAEVGGA